MNTNDNIEIIINSKNMLTTLTTRDKGEQYYKEQLETIINTAIRNINCIITICFPNNIKLVSGSFLLGMFEEIYNLIGIDGIKKRFIINSNTGDDLKEILICELKRSAC